MYFLSKKMEISCQHHLPKHKGICRNLHGHNWYITVHCFCANNDLNAEGMIIDFGEIKKVVNKPDHGNLNDYLENPTAENIARWICEQIDSCYMVEVEETADNKAVYVNDSSIHFLATALGISKS